MASSRDRRIPVLVEDRAAAPFTGSSSKKI
jgi:hypothetical protein